MCMPSAQTARPPCSSRRPAANCRLCVPAAKANVNARDDAGGTALHRAASSGFVEIVRELQPRGPCPRGRHAGQRSGAHVLAVNTATAGRAGIAGCRRHVRWAPNGQLGISPLASSRGDLETAAALLARAPTPMRRRHGDTALHKASSKGHLEAVQLAAKADVNARRRDGDTACPAAQQGSLEVVEALILRRELA